MEKRKGKEWREGKIRKGRGRREGGERMRRGWRDQQEKKREGKLEVWPLSFNTCVTQTSYLSYSLSALKRILKTK